MTQGTTAGASAPADAWWRSAVIYQVYPRSFADSDGDGVGDLRGARAHLADLAQLGVDAIWVTPWYASPMEDGGYDVADYRAIDPVLGDIEEAEALIAEARDRGIRTIIDIVPNHVSARHAWFREALAAPAGSPQRARFWFRDGRGDRGELPPTDWTSEFGGGTWTRVAEPDGTPGQWYLHLFDDSQPDLNWDNPEVAAEFLEVLRFWLDRGVAGVRVDSAALISKDPALPPSADGRAPGSEHPYLDRDRVHDVYRSWRALLDDYTRRDGDERILVGEVWLEDAERFAHYLRPDEMHCAFNFDFMARPWGAAELRDSIDRTLAGHGAVGAPATWVLSNHDVTRPVTRYGREDSSFSFATKRFGIPTDLRLGERRARAAAVLVACLPGALYIYQGDELGLPEVEDIPRERLTDPMYARTRGSSPGRDGCRVPIPWSGDRPPYGFTAPGASTWLPQPEGWGPLTVEAERRDPASMLHLYGGLIERRHREEDLRRAPLRWIEGAPDGVLAFRRGRLVCAVSVGAARTALPSGTRLLIASDPTVRAELFPDTAVLLEAPDPVAEWREASLV